VQGSTPSPRRRRRRPHRVAPPATSATRRRASATPITALGNWVLGNPLSAVTVLGLCLYGFLRYVYARFYSPLGVKPEEVGLGYAEILSQSVMGLLLFSALMFLLLLVGTVLVIIGALIWGGLFREIQSDIRRDRRKALWTLVGMAVIVAVVAVVEAVGWGIGLLLGSITFLLAWGLVATIQRRRSRRNATPEESKSKQPATSQGKQPATSQGKQPGRSARTPLSTARVRRQVRSLFAGGWWRRGVIAVFLLTLAVVALTLVGDAQLGAAKVLRGEAWCSTFGGMPFTSMEARRATVVWSSGTPPSGLHLGDDLLYLGQSNGITVFYDAGTQRSIRLPSSDVIVSLEDEEPACPSRE
jgi:hypothetical protein